MPCRSTTADLIAVVAHAAVQDDGVLPVGGVDDIEGLAVDIVAGRISDQRRDVGEWHERVARLIDRLVARAPLPLNAPPKRFRCKPGIAVDPDALVGDLEPDRGRVLDRPGVELERGLFLVRQDVDPLVAALRAGGERPIAGVGMRRNRRVRQRADIGQHRVLGAGPAGQRQMLSVTLYSPVSVPKSCRAVWKSRLTKPYQFWRGMPAPR